MPSVGSGVRLCGGMATARSVAVALVPRWSTHIATPTNSHMALSLMGFALTIFVATDVASTRPILKLSRCARTFCAAIIQQLLAIILATAFMGMGQSIRHGCATGSAIVLRVAGSGMHENDRNQNMLNGCDCGVSSMRRSSEAKHSLPNWRYQPAD